MIVMEITSLKTSLLVCFAYINIYNIISLIDFGVVKICLQSNHCFVDSYHLRDNSKTDTRTNQTSSIRHSVTLTQWFWYHSNQQFEEPCSFTVHHNFKAKTCNCGRQDEFGIWKICLNFNFQNRTFNSLSDTTRMHIAFDMQIAK